MFKIIPLAFLIWLFVFDKSVLTYAQVIHKTRSGDTLTKIAVQYNTKTVSLAKLNGLNKNSHLVLGQAILIPGSSYIVQPGDSIAKIANQHAISTESLMSYNHLQRPLIFPNEKLNIPRSSKMNIWTGTYFVPRDKNTNAWMIEKYKKTLSGLFLFDYHPNEKGQLIKVNENEAHKIAWNKGLFPYATITNTSKKGYDPDLIHKVLSDTSIRSALIMNIYSLLIVMIKGIWIRWNGLLAFRYLNATNRGDYTRGIYYSIARAAGN